MAIFGIRQFKSDRSFLVIAGLDTISNSDYLLEKTMECFKKSAEEMQKDVASNLTIEHKELLDSFIKDPKYFFGKFKEYLNYKKTLPKDSSDNCFTFDFENILPTLMAMQKLKPSTQVLSTTCCTISTLKFNQSNNVC